MNIHPLIPFTVGIISYATLVILNLIQNTNRTDFFIINNPGLFGEIEAQKSTHKLEALKTISHSEFRATTTTTTKNPW